MSDDEELFKTLSNFFHEVVALVTAFIRLVILIAI